MVRLDSHLHVGEVYGGRAPSTPAEPARCARFLKDSGTTHAVVCYSKKSAMDELVKLCPDVKFYKLQWVTDYDQKLDKGIHGIKVHSHRGQSSGFSFGEEDNDRGLDYSSKKMRELLARLPEGFIVEYHTQGSSSLSSTSRPFVVGKLAIENRHLKHIIVHSGAFGMRSFYPSSFNASLLTTAISQEMLVQEAVLMANRLPNVYCDSSTLIGPGHYKTDLLFSFTRKVSLSSDWPFSEVCPYGPVTKSEQLLARYNGADSVAELHTRAIDWLEKPMKDIFKEQGEIANVNNGRSQRYMEIRAELDSRKKKNR